MKSPNSIPRALGALLLCTGLSLAATQASAAGNRCVDVEGQVTLTDGACPQGSRAVNDDVSDSGAVGIAFTTDDAATEHVSPAMPLAELPRSRWADLPRPLIRKTIGTDAMTLQAARTTLLMRDEVRRQGRSVATR